MSNTVNFMQQLRGQYVKYVKRYILYSNFEATPKSQVGFFSASAVVNLQHQASTLSRVVNSMMAASGATWHCSNVLYKTSIFSVLSIKASLFPMGKRDQGKSLQSNFLFQIAPLALFAIQNHLMSTTFTENWMCRENHACFCLLIAIKT